MNGTFPKNLQFYKFCAYGFFKNLRFFDPFIILFFRELNLSFFQIGLLFSIREISINILEVPTGIIADTLGRRRAMITSFSAYICSFIIFYLFGNNFWFSSLAMVGYAIGETFRSGTHKAMILEYLRLKNMLDIKVDYYGRTRSCSQMGSALSSLVAAVLVFYTGTYRIVFLASIIPYIMDLLLIISYPKELDGVAPLKKTSTKGIFKFIVDSFKDVVKNKSLRRILVNTSLGSASFKVSKDYLQPFLKSWAFSLPVLLFLSDNQRSAMLIGIVYFIIFLFSSFASNHAGKFQQYFRNSANALNSNFFFNILLYFCAGLGIIINFNYLSLFAFLGIFIIQNFQRPIMVGCVAEVTSPQRMATILSIENQSRAIWVAIFAPIIGTLADAYSIAGGLLGYSVILLFLFPLARVK
jgi:MFS family permease